MKPLLHICLWSLMLLSVASYCPVNKVCDKKDEKEERVIAELEEVIKDLEHKLQHQNSHTTYLIDDVQENAVKWLNEYDEEGSKRLNKAANAEWNYETDINDENSKKDAEESIKFSEWSLKQAKKAEEFLKSGHVTNGETERELKKIALTSSPKDEKKLKELTDIGNKLSQIYGEAKACNKTKCYSGEPDLENVMATSRDYYVLLWSWKEWRAATGPKMKPLYEKFIDLLNVGARDHGFTDMSEYWSVSNFEQTNKDLSNMADQLWEEVKPMYEQLHAYVRRKLKAKYPMANIQDGGPIPAHLLGNIWAQQWNQIYDIVMPYPGLPSVDVTNDMVKQKYTPLKMFQTAESFFKSIGLPPMTREFWERSMIEKPKNRTVQCHGSASDFSNGRDFRIKMCTRITMDDLKTVHHEMGHVQYYMAYKDQPLPYREGLNSAAHEAIGDTIAMSVMTPEHLTKLKLLKQAKLSKDEEHKMNINFLMSQALFKIAFLPFGLLIDKWRWGVFKGEIDSSNYNKKWWDLRMKYQGLIPPVERSEKDFDPGSKYHIPSNTPYMRYFISYLVQFQFHSALCEAAENKGPLHRCDIFGSKEAGERLVEMLRLGSSHPWPDALEVLTDQRKIDTSKIKKYFQPLLDWLHKQNGGDVGWNLPKKTTNNVN